MQCGCPCCHAARGGFGILNIATLRNFPHQCHRQVPFASRIRTSSATGTYQSNTCFTSCSLREPDSLQSLSHRSLLMVGWDRSRTWFAVSVSNMPILSSGLSSESPVRLMAVLVNVPHPLRREGSQSTLSNVKSHPLHTCHSLSKKDTLSKPYGDLTGSSLPSGSVKSVGRVVLSLEINLLALS